MVDQNHKWLTFLSAIFHWVIITLGDEYHLSLSLYIYISKLLKTYDCHPPDVL
jgi:hypothetical protein